MKRYFRFRKDFRCNWYGLLGIYDTNNLKEQEVEEYQTKKKHKWFHTKNELFATSLYYADVFIFESSGETQEYVDDLNKTLSGLVYFVRKEDEADNIEELVDCYAYGVETTKDIMVARSWKRNHKDRTIYACISTETGIINIGEIDQQEKIRLFYRDDREKKRKTL